MKSNKVPTSSTHDNTFVDPMFSVSPVICQNLDTAVVIDSAVSTKHKSNSMNFVHQPENLVSTSHKTVSNPIGITLKFFPFQFQNSSTLVVDTTNENSQN